MKPVGHASRSANAVNRAVAIYLFAGIIDGDQTRLHGLRIVMLGEHLVEPKTKGSRFVNQSKTHPMNPLDAALNDGTDGKQQAAIRVAHRHHCESADQVTTLGVV